MSKTNIFTLELLFSPPSLLHLPSSFYQTAAPYTGYLGEILETQSRFCLLYSLRAIQQQILEAFIFQVYPVLNAFSLSLLLLPGPCYHLLPPGLVNQLVNYSFLRVICNILYCSILLLNNNQERAFKMASPSVLPCMTRPPKWLFFCSLSILYPTSPCRTDTLLS